MRFSSALFLMVFFATFSFAKAQPVFFSFANPPTVSAQGETLTNAWAGGLNSPQFASMHLNEDEYADIIVFDKTSSTILPFLARKSEGEVHYQYDPNYVGLFPEIRGWMQLLDYDADGRKDLFAHTNFGIQVHRNEKENGSTIFWKKIVDPLQTQGSRGLINLQVNILDKPAIVDLDQDGDLDILCFDFVQGSFIEYHKNLSVEQNSQPGLSFKKVSSCWGHLFEGLDCGDFSFDLDCPDHQEGGGGGNSDNRVNHIGSTLELLDLNGDKQLDLLVGDVSCRHLYRMINTRSSEEARFDSFEANFPSDHPVDMAIFPAAYQVDVDLDGRNDLLVSPNVFTNEANSIDFQNSAWYYRNVGNRNKAAFSFQQSNFLQHTMIDLGESTSPLLFDYDEDQDLDLLVGNRGSLQDSQWVATLYLYENIGNATQAHFNLVDDDFLGLKEKKLTQIQPLLADFNEDQRPDLAFTAQQGRKTELYYFENQSSGSFQFDPGSLKTFAISFENRDKPIFYDADQDGDVDILVGKGKGNLAYYENQGKAAGDTYLLVNDTLGGIAASALAREAQLCIHDFNQDGEPDLILGNAAGQLSMYPSFQKQWPLLPAPERDFFYDLQRESFGAFPFRNRLSPSAGDLDGDGFPELILGSQGGGLYYLKNSRE